MLPCFQSDGIFPQLSDFLKIIKRIGEINSLHSLKPNFIEYPAMHTNYSFIKLHHLKLERFKSI